MVGVVAKQKAKPKHTFNGKRLRELREEKGITQEQLGESIGKNHVAVSRIESGAVQPTLDTAAKLAAAIGVSLDELVTAPPKAG